MEENTKGMTRGSVGFGSSYRKGTQQDLKQRSEIGAVLGGQVWMIKPDKDAKASNPCLWMRAGLVEFKNCSNFYDCTTCKYDQGMKKAGAERKADQLAGCDEKEIESRKGLPAHSHPIVSRRRTCAYDYECSKCDFDQFFEEVWATKTGPSPMTCRRSRAFRSLQDPTFTTDTPGPGSRAAGHPDRHGRLRHEASGESGRF